MITRIKVVNDNAERGERPEYVKKEEQKRLDREENRLKALTEWETINSHLIIATGMAMCHPVHGPWPEKELEANLPPVGDERVVTWVR